MCSFPTGQGHGIKNRYGGLPDEYSRQENSAIVILPVPFEMTTTYQTGTRNGPSALIEASRNMELYDIETNTSVYKKGIYTAPFLTTSSSENMRQQLYTQTIDFINQGKLVVALGGEHSISYALIQAHAEKFPGMSVLQIDAHADLQESYEGNSWSHASVMARVRELSSISSIVSVGIRSMSEEESFKVDASRTFFAHQLDSSRNWVEKVEQQLSDTVYITFDLDGFDSSLMPSTGTPEPGGLDWNQVMALLRHIIQKKQVVGLDVVELCPSPTTIAPDYLAAKLVYKVLSYHFFYHSV